MRAIDRYSRLEALGRPVVTTGEAAVAWETSLPVAASSLARLANSGLVAKIRHGIWQIGAGIPDPAIVLPVLTNPYPSYISGWSALARHGMIEQIPRGVFAASLDRARSVETVYDRFEIHHVHPDLFGGFEGGSSIRSGIATPEKALFDTVYLFSTRNGQVTLPELELPHGFNVSRVQRWIETVPSARLRTMTAHSLARIIDTATRAA
jgi:predicted transcriptional regulator of viral defense system